MLTVQLGNKNMRIHEGDIVLTNLTLRQQEELWNHTSSLNANFLGRQKRQAYQGRDYPKFFWKNGVVPYTLSSNLSMHARSIILKSMKFWESQTCITFVPATREKSSLIFIRGSGCFSYIGRIWEWKEQPLSVGWRCEHIHTITHEIGHALGFLHTHTRVDRDQYISVNFRNIRNTLQTGLTSNFKRAAQYANYNYNLPYDYGSVMHYSKKAFTSNNGSTIIPRISWYEDTMGSGTGPTFIDILMMNKHYKCTNLCRYSIQCKNGGYQHPKHCNRCLCPSGYGGSYCDQRASFFNLSHTSADSSGCGGNLRATHQWKVLSTEMGNGRYKDEMSYCYWWIEAKAHEIIEVRIKSLSGCCSEGCIFAGLEVKANLDKRLTGYRFCCEASVGRTVEAQGPILPLIMFNRKDYSLMEIQYRIKKN
ncbi:unnamed protein product [Thelazia callipaeda]|uniref:Zinc metalloproteinase n=1 Tax=Thelazia callipaeda TaxID=103827 RepID=A0A158RBK8_THECL|nr:unnamed protein product [Thelazia callipaeda]